MTDSITWRPVGAVDPRLLVEARNQAHHAVQLPAIGAIAYAPFRDDYSHINFGWANALSAFVSHDIPTPRGIIQLGLRLVDLTLLILGDRTVKRNYALHGKTHAEAQIWLLKELENFGLDVTKYTAIKPSELPDHPVTSGAAYDVETHAQAMAEFCNYYGNANLVLETLRTLYLPIKPGPNDVRMWPHHFDIAVLVTLEDGNPETAKAFGFGFEPGDQSCEQPYFYTYPWPRSHRPDPLPELLSLGQWTLPGTWFGTLLRGEDIWTLPAEQQQAAVEAYLHDAAEKCKAIAIHHP